MSFYKIVNNKAQTGNVSHGAEWIEYTVGQEPQELIDGLVYKTPAEIQEVINTEALAYLASTDWYVIRLQETGVVIPQDILDARASARLSIVVV